MKFIRKILIFFKTILTNLGRMSHKLYSFITLQSFWDDLIDSGLMKEYRVPFRLWLSDKLPQYIVNALCVTIALLFAVGVWAAGAAFIVVPIWLVLHFLGIWR